MFGANLFAESVFADLPDLEYVEVEYSWQLACKAKNLFTAQAKSDSLWGLVKTDKYTVKPCKE